jgi:hypothetical protein
MKIQLASGSGKIEVEDLSDLENLGQVKSCRGNTISLKISDLENLVANARSCGDDGVDPIMFIRLVRSKAILAPRNWALVPLEIWRSLRWRCGQEKHCTE